MSSTVATEVGAPQAETIGQRLRRLRTERQLSQRELSSPGVSYAYISRIEAGTRNPSVKAIRMLAGKLGVPEGYLEYVERELRRLQSQLTGNDPTTAAARERVASLIAYLTSPETRAEVVERVAAD